MERIHPQPLRHVYSEQATDEYEQRGNQETEEGGGGGGGTVTSISLAAGDSYDESDVLVFAMLSTSTLDLSPNVISANLLFLHGRSVEMVRSLAQTSRASNIMETSRHIYHVFILLPR